MIIIHRNTKIYPYNINKFNITKAVKNYSLLYIDMEDRLSFIYWFEVI